jgi:hypothetical protein
LEIDQDQSSRLVKVPPKASRICELQYQPNVMVTVQSLKPPLAKTFEEFRPIQRHG